MGEVCVDTRTILVNYRCDNCNEGIVFCEDSYCEKDDNGDYHMLYIHRCPVCGCSAELEDIKYPYPKIIPTGSIRELTPEERM